MNAIARPVLRYHGGKFGNKGRVAEKIIASFPPHRVYVEPFGGGGSVLLRKPRSYAEVYNDKWDIVVNVFSVLRDRELSEQLESALRLTPFSRSEFQRCGHDEMSAVTDPVEKARRTIFRSFAGFGSASTNGAHSTGFRSNSNRSGTTPAHDWANYPDYIKHFTARLRGVVIENRNAVDVIAHHDSAETLFYVDPPYVHSTRNMQRGNAAYACEMTDDDHRKLAATLNAAVGMAVLSGYESALYDELYGSWEKTKFAALADGARKRTECLWFNAAASAARKLPLEAA
jgi:DNA adenine methylase